MVSGGFILVRNHLLVLQTSVMSWTSRCPGWKIQYLGLISSSGPTSNLLLPLVFRSLQGTDTARAFFHLPLVCLLLILTTDSDPQSCLMKEQASPWPPCPGLDCMYQAVTAWWEKQALSSQPPAFPLGPSPILSFRIMDTGFLSQARKFASTPTLSKTGTPSGVRTASSEAIQSKFSA